MKNLIKYLFCLLPLLSAAQNVEDFAKINIPSTFSDFDENQYQMNQYLRFLLKQKDFEVISENEVSKEELYDPCETLFADIKDESNWFRTKLNIEFRDCRNELVANYKGETQIKDLREGHIDAMKDAVSKIGSYNGNAYSSNSNIQKAKKNAKEKAKEKAEADKTFAEKIVDGVKEAADVVVEEVKKVTNKKETQKLDDSIFTDGFREYQLTKKGKVYALEDLTLNSIFATFYPTRNNEIYQVKFADETSAVGYIYNDKIIMEKYNEAGDKNELILKRK